MANPTLSVEVPGIDFVGMAREMIAAKLTESMMGADDQIQKIVAAALATKVNDHGNVGNYSCDNKTPYVEWLAQQLIREATKKALSGRVEALRPVLEAQIEKQLSKNTKSIANTLTESFVRNVKSGYGYQLVLTADMKMKD